MNTELQDTKAPAVATRDRSRVVWRTNLFLVVAVALCVTFWFKRHMEFYVTEGLLVGGTVTLWGLWQIITSILNWGAEDELKSIPARVLNGVNATKFLSFCLLMALGLHFVTSSIHAEYVPTVRGAGQYVIDILHATNRQPFLKPLEVSSVNRVSGQPFFFRTTTAPLKIVIREPRGFAPREVPFRFNSRIHLRVPDDFDPKRFHLLRFVPSPKLLNQLSEPGGPVETRYDLELIWRGQTNVIEDLRKQTVYVGAEAEDIAYVLARETPARRRAIFHHHLASLSFRPENREPHAGLWETNRLFFTTPELRPADKVQALLRHQGETNPVFAATITMEATNEIQTVFLLTKE